MREAWLAWIHNKETKLRRYFAGYCIDTELEIAFNAGFEAGVKSQE